MSAGPSLTLHKQRIEALADGLFAIVLTLLVLELKVPELPRSEAELHLTSELGHLLPIFLGFLITFMVGGLFWYLHHLSFHFIDHTTPRVVVANLVFLGFASLLPFTMALYSRYQGLTLPSVCYFGNFLGMALGLNLHWWVAGLDGLIVTRGREADLKALTWRIRSLLAGSAAGLLVACFRPSYAIYAFIGVMLVLRVIGRQRAASVPA